MRINIKSERIKLISVILICLFCMAIIVFAWFSRNAFAGSKMNYHKQFSIIPASTEIKTYAGFMNKQGKIIYNEADLTETGLNLSGIYPGYRQYFKTDLKNKTNKDIVINLDIENIQYNPELNDHVTFFITDPKPISGMFNDNYTEIFDSHGTKKYQIASIRLAEDYEIPANSTVSVYWFVYIETDLENEAMNTSMLIQKMRVTYS